MSSESVHVNALVTRHCEFFRSWVYKVAVLSASQPNSNAMSSSNALGRRRQGVFWLLTIPEAGMLAPQALPPGTQWFRGQLEVGEGGYRHWQCLVALSTKGSLSTVKSIFGSTCHAELSRSEAAIAYVWKDDTSVAGTRFEFGCQPIRRNQRTDWENVWSSAKSGDLLEIPAQIRVVSYRTLRTIGADHSTCPGIVRTVFVFWGVSGSGKSRRAWEEAGLDAYCKDPRTKFWDGYQHQLNVVIDEFRGGIDIAHLLRWFDRYPVRVEIKGCSRPLLAERIWITSNLCPERWYPDLDAETLGALMRRLIVTEFN